MPIVATAGASDANSYAELTEAVDYFANRPNAEAWLTAQSFDREQALIWATTRLDLIDWVGDRAGSTQALEWPRVINDFYRRWIAGTFPFADDEIPAKLKYAQFELALYGLANPGSFVDGAIRTLEITDVATIGFSQKATLDWMGLPVEASHFLKGLRQLPVLA